MATASGSDQEFEEYIPPKPKCLVTHPKVPEAAIKLLNTKFQVIFCHGKPPKYSDILNKCKNVDAILWAHSIKLDENILNSCGSKLKVVSTMSNHFNCIDVAEMKSRGIVCGYTPDVSDASIAEMAIGLMLAAGRHLNFARTEMERGRWRRESLKWMLGYDLRGAVVGFIGFGSIGQKIADRLMGFGIQRILYYEEIDETSLDCSENSVEFEDLLMESDIIFAVCPLTYATRKIVDQYAFSNMKENCVFVNVTNSEVVDQNALHAALRTKRIAAAALDGTIPAELPTNHKLLQVPNCVITPNLQSETYRTKTNMALLAVHNIFRGYNKEELYASVY